MIAAAAGVSAHIDEPAGGVHLKPNHRDGVTRRPSLRRDVGVMYMVAVAFCAALIIMLTDPGPRASGLYIVPYLIGGAIFPFLFGLLVSGLACLLRVRSATVLRVIFAVGAIALPLAAVMNASDAARRRSLAESLRGLAWDMTVSPSAPSPAAPHLTSKEAGEAGIVVAMGRRLSAEVKRDTDAFNARVQAVVADGIIRPDQLDSSADIAALRSKLAELRKITDEREAWCAEYYASFPQRVNDLNVSQQMKTVTLAVFAEGDAEARKHLSEFFAVERAFFNELESLGDLMAECQGRFSTDATNVYFRDTQDLVRYRQIRSRIDQLVAEEAQVAGKMMHAYQRQIDEVNRIASELSR